MDIPVAIPRASSDPLPEIAAFLEPFAPLFRRVQSRQPLERNVTGLLTDLARKNCDTIAAAAVACMRSLCGSCIQSLREFEEWHSEEVLHHSGGRVPMSHIKPNGTGKWF